ncbi:MULTISPECIES: hypothetical protein [unclassified Pseudofrankia]|uniref:hypothetical protein n=1 Tax=unclassified Pseudofrankia TaxID=2994372 RepID=UPI0018E2B467|nr:MULTISPECIES: hypothetical protein [unclassified Pseudofrankia]MDT3444827.1 hypothetical protein [Pseudofrankia sp. BMG5.37]
MRPGIAGVPDAGGVPGTAGIPGTAEASGAPVIGGPGGFGSDVDSSAAADDRVDGWPPA